MKRFVVTIIAAAVMVSTTSVLSAETRIQQREEVGSPGTELEFAL